MGSLAFREEAVRSKVIGWVEDVRRLSALGRVHPQVAYCLLVRTLLPRWRFTMRTSRVAASLFEPLEESLVTVFFPAVFRWQPDSSALRRRCALPCRKGGLGIPVVSTLAEEEAEAATLLTGRLKAAILRQDFEYREDVRASATRRRERLLERDRRLDGLADELAEGLSGRAARGFEEARLRGGSAWLSVIPLQALGLDLDAQTFRDAVALRMGLDLPDGLPPKCPSCGSVASVDHLLKCKRGG